MNIVPFYFDGLTILSTYLNALAVFFLTLCGLGVFVLRILKNDVQPRLSGWLADETQRLLRQAQYKQCRGAVWRPMFTGFFVAWSEDRLSMRVPAHP